MKIQVTGRRFSVTDGIREYITEKTERLAKFLGRINRVEVVLDGEKKKGEFSAEMIVHAPRRTFLVSHSREKSAPAALDSVLDKMERQVKKFNARLRSRNGRKRMKGGVPVPEAAEEVGEADLA